MSSVNSVCALCLVDGKTSARSHIPLLESIFIHCRWHKPTTQVFTPSISTASTHDRPCMTYIYARVVLPSLTQLFSFLWHGNPSRLVLLCGIYLFSNGVATVEIQLTGAMFYAISFLWDDDSIFASVLI
ncbi:hypothetical protein CY34DRAFT_164431 [Suillus luteus UH-Slu-Lm8-n1]|uniref:Uncharacterized protein n=1 Tax=Suillus luteus UH-Slu-Lm8-n1 TaxID=930992 RepID=A0A0D0AJP7_9AGAM|nr:hypothetical protein CY34DRAFT_164431 [Suillus luteus UH-Slu-Lm8-n1]